MINYLKGNALEPIGDGKKIIVHCCNDIGAWGSGFVIALSKKWKEPEKEYRSMPTFKRKLGCVQIVVVENDIMVANIIGQHNIKPNEYNIKPIRYVAIQSALQRVAELAKTSNASIHMPRIGCFRAGGSWSIMEKVIESAVNDVDVFVYDLPNNSEGYNK